MCLTLIIVTWWHTDKNTILQLLLNLNEEIKQVEGFYFDYTDIIDEVFQLFLLKNKHYTSIGSYDVGKIYLIYLIYFFSSRLTYDLLIGPKSKLSGKPYSGKNEAQYVFRPLVETDLIFGPDSKYVFE